MVEIGDQTLLNHYSHVQKLLSTTRTKTKQNISSCQVYFLAESFPASTNSNGRSCGRLRGAHRSEIIC